MYLGCGCIMSALPGCVEYNFFFTQSGPTCTAHTPYTNQFISCSVRGVFSSVFCDFGPEFTILDNNGEEPVECFIGNISKVNHLQCTCQIVAPPSCMIQADDLISARNTPDAAVITSNGDVCSYSCRVFLCAAILHPVPNHS